LLKHLDAIDCDYRVTQAKWEYSSYELLDRAAIADGGRAAPAAGHAVIEEVCGCGDSVDEHNEDGCTAEAITDGRLTRCGCPAYRPITGEPALFDLPAAHRLAPDARAAS
jgi:hypothetical protein